MTAEEIRSVVSITLDELSKRNMLKDDYAATLNIVDTRLKKFFSGTKDSDVGKILRALSEDAYIDVIYLQYRDGLTLEYIAETFDKDVSTIKRNKKRLIKTIHRYLQEGAT